MSDSSNCITHKQWAKCGDKSPVYGDDDDRTRVPWCSDHLEQVLCSDGLKKAVKRILERIAANCEEFDAIAFQGVSGSLVAPLIAYELDKNLIVVRKIVTPHCNCIVETNCSPDSRYIIVDDLIDNGSTVSNIREKIDFHIPSAVFKGVYLYGQNRKSSLSPDLDCLVHYCGRYPN